MRLIFAVLACGLLLVNTSAEVELITEPRPGEEFVLFRASTIGSGRSADANAKLELDSAPELVTARVLSSKTSGSLELVVGAHTGNVDSEEVQTEVSVVTSKNVHVDGVTVKPAAASGVQSRPADHEEARIMARKIADSTKKATFLTEKPSEVTDTAASEHIVVKSEAESGLVKTPISKTQYGEISVPPGKFQSSEEPTVQPPRAFSELPPPLNVLSTGPRKAFEEGGLHGKGVISDAPLVSAGSQPQSSRIVVKKGPNGEDYEYEYVYYYDDETDESANNTALDLEETDEVSAPASTTSTSTTAAPTTTTSTTTTAASVTDEKLYSRRYLPTSRSDTADSVTEASDAAPTTDEDEEDEDEPPSRTRGRGWSNARGGNPQHSQQHEETERVRNGGASSSGGRVRYTTIDRTRQSVAEEEAANSAAITERPATNEVVPARGGNRFRGRQQSPQTEAPEPTERLPQNTRFPPRRSNITPAPHDAPPARAAVRPSLELVDSSSFRTGAAISSSADLPSFPAVPGGPNAPVRFLGVTAEDATVESSTPSRRRGRPTTTTSTTTSTTTTEAAVSTTESSSTEPPPSANSLAVEKAAYDLYAILQQAQDNIQENVVQEDDVEAVESTTPEDTTLPPTTTAAPTTTSTSTTPEPSTEPSTTTTTAASSGRGRYRNRGNSSPQQNQNTRTRVRRPEVTNAVPAPESPVNHEVTSPKTRHRFGSSISRRTTTAAPVREEETNENEAPTVSTRPRNRFRASPRSTVPTPTATQLSSAAVTHHGRPSFPPKRRGFPISTAAPTQSSVEESEVSNEEATAPVSSSPKPVTRANTRLRAPVRPLRAGRIGLTRPGALTTATSPAPSTTAVDASQESAITPDTAPASEEVAAAPESSEPQEEEVAVTTPQPGTLTRLRNRPRLHITGRTSKPQSAAQSSAASPSSRRDLVKSLLPRRGRPTPTPELEAEPAPVEPEAAAREEEELGAQEAASAEQAPPTSVPAPVEPEKESRLSSLLKNRNRKPGGLFHSRQHSTEAP